MTKETHVTDIVPSHLLLYPKDLLEWVPEPVAIDSSDNPQERLLDGGLVTPQEMALYACFGTIMVERLAGHDTYDQLFTHTGKRAVEAAKGKGSHVEDFPYAIGQFAVREDVAYHLDTAFNSFRALSFAGNWFTGFEGEEVARRISRSLHRWQASVDQGFITKRHAEVEEKIARRPEFAERIEQEVNEYLKMDAFSDEEEARRYILKQLRRRNLTL